MMILAEKKKDGIRVSKKCPVCGWRVMDKVTPTSGVVEVKCCNCHNIVQIDLSYRVSRTSPSLRLRLASSF